MALHAFYWLVAAINSLRATVLSGHITPTMWSHSRLLTDEGQGAFMGFRALGIWPTMKLSSLHIPTTSEAHPCSVVLLWKCYHPIISCYLPFTFGSQFRPPCLRAAFPIPQAAWGCTFCAYRRHSLPVPQHLF